MSPVARCFCGRWSTRVAFHMPRHPCTAQCPVYRGSYCTVPRTKTHHTATRAVLFGAKLTTGGDHQLEPGSRGSCCCCVATFYSTTPFMDGVCLQNLGHFEILSEIYLFFATPFNNEANISKTTGILHENNGVIIWLPLSALIPNVRVIEDTVEVKLVSQGI